MFHIAQYFPITDPTLIFFVVLLIILFAPIIMGKLRIPHIIGMVLAGVLIGKYGLNILERDSSFELFGKVGLYYIMFLAALEMDMEGMKKNKSRLLIYGLLTCFIPFFLTYGMSIWLLHYSAKASFLLSCIMASNTLIAYPIVSRYGLQQKPSVTLSVGSSMISLLIALIMLAGLVASFSKHDGVLFWVFFTLKFAVYCGVMIMLIPRLTRWFLRRYSDAVMQFIFVLAMMFFSASLCELAGLEGILGAFFEYDSLVKEGFSLITIPLYAIVSLSGLLILARVKYAVIIAVGAELIEMMCYITEQVTTTPNVSFLLLIKVAVIVCSLQLMVKIVSVDDNTQQPPQRPVGPQPPQGRQIPQRRQNNVRR